jgi:hypothetical protein
MARARRFTVRLNEQELAALNGFADLKRVLPSEALRLLIEVCAALNLGHEGHGQSGPNPNPAN